MKEKIDKFLEWFNFEKKDVDLRTMQGITDVIAYIVCDHTGIGIDEKNGCMVAVEIKDNILNIDVYYKEEDIDDVDYKLITYRISTKTNV